MSFKLTLPGVMAACGGYAAVCTSHDVLEVWCVTWGFGLAGIALACLHPPVSDPMWAPPPPLKPKRKTRKKA